MKKIMKKLLATGLTVTMMLAMAGCGNSDGTSAGEPAKTEGTTETSGELTPVTVYAVNDPQMSAAYYVALDQGYFEEEGLEVTTEVVASGPDLASYVAGGSDVIAMGTMYNLYGDRKSVV